MSAEQADNAEQAALRASVRTLLARRSASAAMRTATESTLGYDEQLWTVLCKQIGVAGLGIPERFGGLGAGLVESQLAMEELGRMLTPSPLLGSAILAGQLLLAIGDEAACARLLPAIAAGSMIAAVCWADSAGHWATESAPCEATEQAPGRWSLQGSAHFVLDAERADVLLVAARAGGQLVVFEVDPAQPSVRRRPLATMDPTRRLSRVEFDGAAGNRLGEGDAAESLRQLRDTACFALAAEQVGAASRCLELTVEYAKVRVQFGRPIGGFQALKHRMADLQVLLEGARSACYPPAITPVAAAVAKTYCSEAFFAVAAETIQLHGGIAITWEHDAHLFFKRAHGSAQLFDPPAAHLRRLADLIGLS